MSWLIAHPLLGAFIGSSAQPRADRGARRGRGRGLLVVAVTVLLGRSEAQVERQLAGYELPDPSSSEYFDPSGQGMIDAPETAMVQQAVAFTSRLAERTGLLARTEAHARAGRRAAPRGRAALLHARVRDPRVPAARGARRAARRSHRPARSCCSPRSRTSTTASAPRQLRFERQLPDTLTLLASSLRAGFSLMQGLEAVAQEISDPMQKELQRVFTEVRLGRPVEDALGDAADRMDSNDLRWTVMAIRIQREVGGNLAVLLDTVADTMVKRERIRRELRALTAEGRLSAIVLSLRLAAARCSRSGSSSRRT